MSFDTDPNESAQVSGADFAMMCDEIKRLRAFVESIVDANGPYPSLNGHRIVRDAYAALNPVNTPIQSELSRLRAENTDLLIILAHLLECIEEPPDRNCSCHINPPCSDCVDHGGLREAIEESRAIIAKATARKQAEQAEIESILRNSLPKAV
ncbi:MAG: hypothetical protein ACOVMP_00850, partial [Chthoniobacterales bacterium]